ncbi:MAG TPA: sterol desaturase family protein, partial [Candidatus Latescibacteria bacterium]|nr:sterol desaturase family protein [Candidatus Latescibacterota bacterium]
STCCSALPLWTQFLRFQVIKDFFERCVHNLRHRVPWLWEFHKLHHSILELDWIGNFRFCWIEIVVYRGPTCPWSFWASRTGLSLGRRGGYADRPPQPLQSHEWGPFTKLINSPRFNVWHHDLLPGRSGQNFAVIFSLGLARRIAPWPTSPSASALGTWIDFPKACSVVLSTRSGRGRGGRWVKIIDWNPLVAHLERPSAPWPQRIELEEVGLQFEVPPLFAGPWPGCSRRPWYELQ